MNDGQVDGALSLLYKVGEEKAIDGHIENDNGRVERTTTTKRGGSPLVVVAVVVGIYISTRRKKIKNILPDTDNNNRH